MLNDVIFYFVVGRMLSQMRVCGTKDIFQTKIIPFQLDSAFNRCETSCANFLNISAYNNLNGCMLQRDSAM